MKKTEKNFNILLVLFVISIVIANVVGSRVITTGISLGPFMLSTSGGAITYAVTFLCTDIAGEVWGKKKAMSMVFFGFVGQIFATVMIILTGFCKAVDADIDAAYKVLLGQNWVFVIGSLCAYYASQTWDVFIFHKIRDKFISHHDYRGQGRWIWNNASTMTSQIIDTFVYAFISFGLGMKWVFTPEGRVSLFGLMLGQYILKACLALLDTPFFYFFTRRTGKEQSDESSTNDALYAE